MLKGILYIGAQCAGAVVGAAILHLFLYDTEDLRGALGLGATGLHPDLSVVQVCDVNRDW